MGNIRDYLTAAKCSYPVWGEENTIYYLDTCLLYTSDAADE